MSWLDDFSPGFSGLAHLAGYAQYSSRRVLLPWPAPRIRSRS
jgi:hypothetical protein